MPVKSPLWPVADILFDGVDADILVQFQAIAVILTGMRTHPSHDRRERIGVGNALEGVFLPAHAVFRLVNAANDIKLATNVVSARAGTLTPGRKKE